MKKEADQAGFKGTRTELLWGPAISGDATPVYSRGGFFFVKKRKQKEREHVTLVLFIVNLTY